MGANTGRPRRCGWFDAALMRQVVLVNSFSGIVLTKLDILDELKTIKICTGYRHHDRILNIPPTDLQLLAECEPIYEEMPGWQTNTHGMIDYTHLPAAARNYIARIETLIETPIIMLSTGPERDQIITIKDIYQ